MTRLLIAIVILLGLLTGSQTRAEDDPFVHTLEQSKTYLQQGRYQLALKTIQSVQPATAAQNTQKEGFLGLLSFQTHDYDQAKKRLQNAVHEGMAASRPTELARWQATLANLESIKGNNDEAERLYDEALKLSGSDNTLTIQIRLGRASLLPIQQRLETLKKIQTQIAQQPNSAEQARFLINIGSQALSLGANGVQLAYAGFEKAVQSSADQPRLQAEALGGLAQLYEEDRRTKEALELNRRAIHAAQTAEAKDLQIDLNWRKARLHHALNEPNEALAAYLQAVQQIEAIRQDIPVSYADGRSSFRDMLEPIYLGLAELQIETAKKSRPAEQIEYLQKARQTVEKLKQSEMDDFLGGRCALMNAKPALLDTVEPQTAVLYPIIFPERLELLVSTGSAVKLYTQDISATVIQTTARKFAASLRDGAEDYQDHALKLHQWLIAPIKAWLAEQRVQTLVIVPDGALRLIPMAALYDGSRYLIEDYALATSPGLTVIEPIPLHQAGVKTLLAGLSEPGPVLQRLSTEYMQGMAAMAEREGADKPKMRSRALQIGKHTRSAIQQGRLAEPDLLATLKKELSLPGVGKEIDSLGRQLPNVTLFNEKFTSTQFIQKAREEHFPIVHIASHGIFRESAENSFLLAYDDVIKFDALEQLFKSNRFNLEPLELLTLSACQTAEGDERAPLGLSGIALKAKVRSAMGSLWPVSDEATYRLMEDFYKHLMQSGIGKAQALRQAQVKLLKEKPFEHPYYWSPFILVGNWL